LAILKDPTEGRFLLPWLSAAALVTVLRFLHAASPGYDLSLQLQAARNLLAGNGLALFRQMGMDLTGPATLVTLTHFPAGYSLYAAALSSLGFSVGTVVKMSGAAATMLGWWGWGKLAYPYFSEGLKRGPLWKWAAIIIAIATPLLYTAEWGGTDVLLWAAVPWVLHWLISASDEHRADGPWLDALAGAVCGLCILMRYASFFLAVYAVFVILWQSRAQITVLTRRWAIFGLGLFPALALQLYVNYVLSNAPATPGGLFLNGPGLDDVLARLWEGVPLLSTANYLWVFWFPLRGLNWFFQEVAGPLPWQLWVALAVFVFLVLIVKAYRVELAAASRDPRVVALGLFVALPLVLWGSMLLGSFNFLADKRYYWPLIPLSIFVIYSFASLSNVPKRGALTRLLQNISVVYLTVYIVVSLACIAYFFVPNERGRMQRVKLMGSESHPWPSMAVSFEFSPARRFVMSLLTEQPHTLLLTSKGGWFYWDPAVDQSRLHELNCLGWRATYVTGPARMVILTFDEGEPNELWYYVGHANNTSESGRADCAEWLPDLKLLRRFPEEGVKVLEARVPAGMQVSREP
jgi:hypothetical protein